MNIGFSKNLNPGVPTREKTMTNSLFEVGLLIVVCGLFFWFVILPKKAVLATKKTDLSALQTQETQISDAITKLKKLEQDLNSNRKEVAYLDQALPLDGKSYRLQQLIESIAQSVGVTVGSVNVSGGSTVLSGNKSLLADPYGTTRKLQKIGGSLYVIGTFNQLLALLNKLESSGRIMDITSMSINGAPNGKLNMQLSINAYYFSLN